MALAIAIGFLAGIALTLGVLVLVNPPIDF